jgi:hypothetical protein
MACCNKPNIKNSTFSDWCANCGWQYDYSDNTESGGSSRAVLSQSEQEQQDKEDAEYRY